MATAFDNAGASRVSTNQVTITVSNSPPSIVVTSPQDGATFTAPATITIIADATDIDGTVTFVDFLDGANFLGSSTNTAAPYTFTWSNVPAGSYSLRAQATDEWNAFTISTNQVNVTVTGGQPGTGPSLTITHTNNSVVISWPASFVGFRLQSKTSLSLPAWSEEPATNNTATVSVTGSAKFFPVDQTVGESGRCRRASRLLGHLLPERRMDEVGRVTPCAPLAGCGPRTARTE
jgi:hypothetical protein